MAARGVVKPCQASDALCASIVTYSAVAHHSWHALPHALSCTSQSVTHDVSHEVVASPCRIMASREKSFKPAASATLHSCAHMIRHSCSNSADSHIKEHGPVQGSAMTLEPEVMACDPYNPYSSAPKRPAGHKRHSISAVVFTVLSTPYDALGHAMHAMEATSLWYSPTAQAVQ